jgi:hypothetical protein
LSSDERGRIDAAVAAVKEANAGTDYKLMRKRIDELNHATLHLAETIMNGAISSALQGRSVTQV